MAAGKQRIVSVGDDGSMSNVHAAAVEAHINAKEAGVPNPDELTSLNKLLQWGAAHSEKPAMAGTDVQSLDREWLSALFPDMNAAVKQLLNALNAELDNDGKPDDIAELLEALEEYLSDINYAQNIGPLKVLPPLKKALTHRAPNVRAGALWAVGSAMQDMSDNCSRFVDEVGMDEVVAGLGDQAASVRLKALRSVSALLRAGDGGVREKVLEVVRAPMVKLVGDADARVRARMMFFVANAASNGNAWILDEVLMMKNEVLAAVREVDASDIAMVEPVVGTVLALVEHNRAKLLQMCPSLAEELAQLAERCESDELRDTVKRCANKVR